MSQPQGIPPAHHFPGGAGRQGLGAGPPPRHLDALAPVGLAFSALGLVAGVLNFFGSTVAICCPVCTLGTTVVGVVSLLAAVVGSVLGLASHRRIMARQDELSGDLVAKIGLIVGIIAVVAAVVSTLLPMLGVAINLGLEAV